MAMRISKRFPTVAVALVFFLFGFALARWTVPSGVSESASTAAGAWSWQGSRYAQVSRCERLFTGPFMGQSFRQTIPGPYRNYASQRSLKFLEFNMLNLFERDFALMGDSISASGAKPTGNGNAVKPEAQRDALAKIVQKSDPDVMVWVEVESQKAAEMFTHKYLSDRYQAFLVEGNDPRGIDVAIMVKKDLPFEVEYRSLKDLTADGEPVFSRDLPIALFRRLDQQGSPVEFVLVGTHYKSKRGDDGGEKKRTAQAEATEQAMSYLRTELGPDVPIFLTGDFNNQVHQSPEFSPLWKFGFKDAHDLSPNPIPADQRGTHFYFSPDGKREVNQIDGFLISGAEKVKVQSSKILPHLDANGNEMPWPQTFKERESRPSDHLATEVVIAF